MAGDAFTHASDKPKQGRQRPSCDTCSFFEERDSTCRIDPIKTYYSTGTILNGWPVIDFGFPTGCGKHRLKYGGDNAE